MRGNLVDLRHVETGVEHKEVHAENAVLLPKQVHDHEHPKKEALHVIQSFPTDSLSDSRRSPGQLLEAAPFEDRKSKRSGSEVKDEGFRGRPHHPLQSCGG